MDPSKVALPTFVLEPRSMLERITDFMSHPDLVFGYVPLLRTYLHTQTLSSADAVPDPEERFIRVLMYYLSGWHVKPKGVKKPYVHLYFRLATVLNTSVGTTQCWASSSGVDTTMPMARMGIILQNRVSSPAAPEPCLNQLELKCAHLVQSRITLPYQRTFTTRLLIT
jgi:hypothetical protein